MSLKHPPGRTASMPGPHNCQAESTRRLPAMVGLPILNMRRDVTVVAVLMLVTSMLTMSPHQRRGSFVARDPVADHGGQIKILW